MEKGSKIVNFIKALAIILTAVLIVTGLSELLLLKSEDGINQMQALYKQPENSIDVFFSGSSKVYCDIATGVLWKNHGIAAFDLAGAEAPSWVSYYQIKEALKTQKPKVICYEVSVAAMYDMLVQADNWASDNAFGMRYNNNRVDMLRINSDEDEFINRLNPFNIIHGRYNDLNENDFTNVRNSVNYKGFDPREMVYEMTRPDNDKITGCMPCTEKEEEYIKKIIKLTNDEGISLVLFASPYPLSDKEQEIINYVGSIAEAEGVEFIDFNRRYDEIGMDFACDMADTGHLNYSGNYKFTDYFGRILKEKYNIPDRRGDKRYVSWDWDAAIQDFERNDLLIESTDDAGEVLTLTQNGYIVFGTNKDRAIVIENGEVIAEGNKGFRIPYRSGNDSFLFVEEGEGDYYHTCSLFVNDVEYKESYGNILFVYDAVRHEYVRSITY